MKLDDKIAERFKIFRKTCLAKNMVEAAKIFGCSHSKISEIESGKRSLGFDMLVMLHNDYALDINWLISGKVERDDIPDVNNEHIGEKKYNPLENGGIKEVLQIKDLLKPIKTNIGELYPLAKENYEKIKKISEKSNQEKGWQICPKCLGSGRVNIAYPTTSNYTTFCDVCDGHKIISICTGMPPKDIG
jgi:transcriptional regulator with XRE-family HTH domain